MAKMRRQLDTGECGLTYGCSAHIIHLLAKDLELSNVHSHVVAIAKYFHNTHLPAAWYKSSGGKSLPLPLEVRWNSIHNTIQAYLDNWSVLVEVCDTHKDNIDQNIRIKVMSIGIKQVCKYYLLRLKPLAVALDQLQSASCSIGQAGFVLNWRKT